MPTPRISIVAHSFKTWSRWDEDVDEPNKTEVEIPALQLINEGPLLGKSRDADLDL